MEGDIVAKLHQNGVTHLVEETFSYLDLVTSRVRLK